MSLSQREMAGRASLKLLVAAVLVTVSTLVLGVGIAAATNFAPPDPPSNITATVVSTGINVQWTAPTNTGTDGSGNTATIASYNVYASTTSGGETTPTCSSSTTTCELTGLTTGDTYYFYVTSVNSASIESSPSSESSKVFTLQPTVTLSTTPSTPTYLGGAVTLTATLDLAAAGIVDFRVNSQDVGCASDAVATTAPPYTATCLYTPTSASPFTVDATFSPSDPSSYESSTATQISVPVSRAHQSALIITTTSGVFGAPLTLNTSGGSGLGGVTYAVADGPSTVCHLTNTDVLSVDESGTCLVIATKAADANFISTTSVQTPVTFLSAAQPALSVVATSGTFGVPLTLSTIGGAGAGTVIFTAVNGTAANCKVTGVTLSASSAGTCLVTAIKTADSDYYSQTSLSTTITFSPAAQGPPVITTTKGVYGSSIKLATSGGGGSGSVTFSTKGGTATNCRVVRGSIAASSAGTCVVRATKAADQNYLAASSLATTFTFSRAAQRHLRLSATRGSFDRRLILHTSGGSGSGSVKYFVTNGTATKCRVSGTHLLAASVGTCLVKATKAADRDFLSASSPTTTVMFAKSVQSKLTLARTQGVFGVPSPLIAIGGSGVGAVHFVVSNLTASGCVVHLLSGRYLLSSTTAGTCVVRIMKDADSDYVAAHSRLLPFIVERAEQHALKIVDVSGTVSTPLAVRVTGGDGVGRLKIAVTDGTAKGCALQGTEVLASTDGTCEVVATKQGDENYLDATSATAVFHFVPVGQSALMISSANGTAGTPITLATIGGSGNGAVSFHLLGGSSATCRLIGSVLMSTKQGTCLVEAKKMGDGVHAAATSKVASIVFVPRVTALSVSPNVGLKSGESLRIVGSGFTPNEHVVIAECLVEATSFAMCDQSRERIVQASANGTLPMTSLSVFAIRVGSRMCGVRAANLGDCEVHASNATFTGASVVDLTFAPLPGRHLYVTPSNDLKNGEVVTLSGTGFIPGDRVYFAECLQGALDQSRCVLGTFKSVIISSTGVFPTTHLRVATGPVGPESCGTTSHDLGACDISVANSSLSDDAFAALSFARPR